MEIEFLELSASNSPVKNFLSSLSPKVHKKVLRNLEMIGSYPPAQVLHLKIFDKVTGYEKYNLYEFRTRFHNTQCRVLCCVLDSTIYLIHGFIKKSPQLPKSEIETAVQRIKLYLLTP